MGLAAQKGLVFFDVPYINKSIYPVINFPINPSTVFGLHKESVISCQRL